MNIPSRSILVLMLALFLLSLFINLGMSPLEFEEPRRALIATEMVESGEYVVPTQIGELYHKKPPLFNWALVASSTVFGQTEFAYRLVTVLSMLFMGFLIFRWVSEHHSKELGLFSSIAFLFSAHLYFYLSMLAEIDMFYSALTLWMIMVLYDGLVRKNYARMYILGYTLCAAGVLTKGLPSIVFMVLTLGALWIISRFKFRPFLNLWHLAGLALGFAIAGGYFYIYSLSAPLEPYFEGLWSQSSERTPLEHSTADTVIGILKNVGMFMKDMLPVSIFFPLLFFRKVRKEVWKNKFLRATLILFLVNLLPYIISPGARSRYLMMLYPLGIIFFTGLIYEGSKYFKKFHLSMVIYATIVILALLGGSVFALFYDRLSPVENRTLFAIVLFILGCAAAFLLIRQPRSSFFWLILGLIGLRLGLDFYFVPMKTIEGEMAEVKQDAYTVADLTKGENLWLWKPEHDRSFSLGMAYYLNEKREDIIKMNIPCNHEDYFIIHKGEAKGTEFKVYHTFEWKEHEYYLIKFTSCGEGTSEE